MYHYLYIAIYIDHILYDMIYNVPYLALPWGRRKRYAEIEEHRSGQKMLRPLLVDGVERHIRLVMSQVN